MSYLRCICTGMLAYCCLAIYAQKMEVPVNLGGKTFASTLPFDESFHLSIPANDNISRIKVRYRIPPGERKNWHYLPKDTTRGGWTNWVEWQNLQNGEPILIRDIGPLHPNVTYEFHLFAYATPDLTPETQEALRDQLYRSLEEVLSKMNIRRVDLDSLSARLQRHITTITNRQATVVHGSGELFKLETYGPELLDIAQEMESLHPQIHNGRANYDIQVEKLLSLFESPGPSTTTVADELYTFLINWEEAKLNRFAAAQWEAPLNPTLEEFSSLTAEEAGRMIGESLQLSAVDPDTLFAKILRGTAKFAGSGVTTAEAPDLTSVVLLRDFFALVANPYFTWSDQRPIWSDSTGVLLGQLAGRLRMLSAQLQLLDKQANMLEALKNKFPDVLTDKLLQEEINILGDTPVMVREEANPYIGVGIGLGYAPKINQFVSSQFVNIYFRPVNKTTPISNLRGTDRWLKTLSLYIGIGQLLGDNEAEVSYRSLLSDNTTPLAGMGFRFNQSLVFNAGGIFFSKRKADDLSSGNDLQFIPTFSFSLDINISRGLSKVGEFLGLQ